MIKSILAAFGSAFGLTFRIILLVILTCGGLYCLFAFLTLPFRWEGASWLGGLLFCALMFRLVLGRRKKAPPPEDDLP